MASIKDVAKAAGVSVMTVSRTLNNNYPVSARTRAEVMKAVKQLDYEPNIMGRNLRRTQSRTVMVAGLGFVDQMLNGIYHSAAEVGYEVILVHTRHFDRRDFLRRLKNGLTSGILFMNMPDEDLIAELSTTYSVVQCGRAAGMSNGCSVVIDEETAVFELTDLLARQGRRRIALLPSQINGRQLEMNQARRKGYLRALAANGLSGDECLQQAQEFLREDYKPALHIAESLVGLPPEQRPDAVICEQNVLAVACVEVFREKGLAVPGDIAVASLEDQPVNEIIKPTITAISRPYETMGREAMQLLAALIENKLSASRQIVFKHDLHWRDST